MLVFSANSYAALTATTANTIQGTKPFLSVSHTNDIKNGNDFKLMSFSVDGFTYNELSDFNSKLSGIDVGRITPTGLLKALGNGTTGALSVSNRSFVASDGGDNDGDSLVGGRLTEASSGSVSIDLYYKNSLGNEVKLNSTQKGTDFCTLANSGVRPYIKLEGPINVHTQYGDPNFVVYDKGNSGSPISGSTNDPKRIYLNIGASTCYARPKLQYSDNGGIYNSSAGQFGATGFSFYASGGPWVAGKGFGVVSTSNPKLNFPTTGSNELFFDLVLAGVTADDIINGYGGGAVTVNSSTTGANIKLELKKQTTNELRITLKGPFYPGSAASKYAVTLPAKFAIEYQGRNVYQFEIAKWYVTIFGHNYSYSTAANACSSAFESGYKVPSHSDYTNSALLTSDQNFVRKIDGSIMGEWGYLPYAASTVDEPLYVKAKCEYPYYWTAELTSGSTATSGNAYTVRTDTGGIQQANVGITSTTVGTITYGMRSACVKK